MRAEKFRAWLTQGTTPRLYLAILAIIVAVVAVRYQQLVSLEEQEAHDRAVAELARVGDSLLPTLVALDPAQRESAARVLQATPTRFGPAVQSLLWQVPGQAPLQWTAPPLAMQAPAWFADLLDIAPPAQRFGQAFADGRTGVLTVTADPGILVDRVWKTVVVQARISALNIFTILFLLTLILRANARMLRRLTEATDRFRQGHLDTRMDIKGALESRAVAHTFNDMAGKVQSLVHSLRETQQLQSEQLHFTRQLIDALPLPVFVREADGTFIDANRAWQRLFQNGDPGLPGQGMFPGLTAPHLLSPAQSRELAMSQDNEVLVQPPGQLARTMAYYEATFTSMNGSVAGTVGTLVDITERKRAEQALRNEKDRAQVTLASIGDGVITTDLAGCIETINEAAQLMTGYTAEQAVGELLDDVFRLYEQPASQAATRATGDAAVGTPNRPAVQEVLLHRSGERYAIAYTASAIRQGSGRASGCVLVFRDVTEASHLRHQISWHARHDALTGLLNRASLAERLTHALFVTGRSPTLLAVCMLDLDHFQAINATHGHRVGDRLLKEVAQRLNAFATGSNAAARLGGDEFVLLLNHQVDVPAIEEHVRQLMQQLAEPYAIDDRVLHTTASIGVAVFPQADVNPDTLLRQADQAMCQAKRSGRNRMHLFDVQLDHAVQTQHSQQTRVAQGLQAGEMRLYYQPKVNLRTGEVLGMEALLRWQHPEQGLLGPQHVLPLLEDAQAVAELGEWVLQEALSQMRQWSLAGVQWEVSVNIAAQHFHRPDFVDRLKDLLLTCPEVSPAQLELEILESAALQDMHYMRSMMRSCQALGVRFALDDFGTGFSSLSYLKRLPAESIKIDQSFVRGILHDEDDLTLVTAIITLAQAFNRHVIAEGVETPAHGDKLLALGCERAQGFGIAPPMPAHEVLAWTRAYEQAPPRHAAQAPAAAAAAAPTTAAR